jgi:hypothetical protein
MASQANILDRIVGNVATSDATLTTCATYACETQDATYTIKGMVGGHKPAATGQGAGYAFFAVVKNDGGVVSLVGSTFTPTGGHEDDTDWACSVTTSGTDFLVQVTGVAATAINWNCAGDVLITRG